MAKGTIKSLRFFQNRMEHWRKKCGAALLEVDTLKTTNEELRRELAEARAVASMHAMAAKNERSDWP